MSRKRPTLLLPSKGLTLDETQRALLREHFDLVESDSTASAQVAPAEGTEDDLAAFRIRAAALLEFDREEIRDQNAVQRLATLERRLRTVVVEDLDRDHFEVRLTNQKTNQLELVIAVGIDPLGVGQQIYARPDDNGICGFVATTGETYVCDDVANDDRYITGIDDARHALVVPLKLGSRIIGVLNAETDHEKPFQPAEVAKFEILADFIAIALHLLSLLVAERTETRRATSEALSSELTPTLDAIRREADAMLADENATASLREHCRAILETVDRARDAVSNCQGGPSTLLGADRICEAEHRDAGLTGRRVIVVDDDPHIVENIARILVAQGCDVVTCADGRSALDVLAAKSGELPIDAIISDVRLPDFTGYEIFRYTHDRHPEVPVILMTGFGYDPHHSIVRASQEGLQSILFKPFKAGQLLDELARACGNEEA